MKILALSGSLRAASINTALLLAMARLAPAGVDISVSDLPGRLPLFNPDRELRPVLVVRRFRAAVLAADALIIASPEYAHGVTGVIKNALDWLVGLDGFSGKPVAVVNAAPRAHIADAALREILVTMAADIVAAASITVPSPRTAADDDVLRRAISALVAEVTRATASHA